MVDELVELLGRVDLTFAVDSAEHPERVGARGGLEEEDEVLVGVPFLGQSHVALEDQVPAMSMTQTVFEVNL